MSVHQRPRAQDHRPGRPGGAAIAGLVTGACLIAVPVELLELVLASSGLSEILPVLAPPFGWPSRIALALCGAAIAAAIAWARGEESAAVEGGAARIDLAGIAHVLPGVKGNGIMGWTRNLGLHHLARLARGEAMADYAVATPAPVRREKAPLIDILSRSRRDMHPDAPPRAPLIASRDLPGAAEIILVEAGPDVAPPPPAIPCASPIRDTTSEARPRPLPRSPAPLSDSDLGWVRGLLAERDAANAERPFVRPAPASAGSEIDTAEQEDSASLLSMVDRFEQGVSQRIALRDAAIAMDRVEESLTGQPAPQDRVPVDSDIIAEGADADQQVDEALNAALETLRRLSARSQDR
ncbi:MAG: hypothetical protein ABW048_01470 [Sphingobium sp.]